MKAFFIWNIVGVIFFISCNNNAVYKDYQVIQNGWHKDSILSFSYLPKDTISLYNVVLNLRNNENYPYSNLFLITKMHIPPHEVIVDTLEYEMTKPNGEWLGKGFSSIKSNALFFKEEIRFSKSDTIRIEIVHAMRSNGNVNGIETLEGILDVGVQIDKTEK